MKTLNKQMKTLGLAGCLVCSAPAFALSATIDFEGPFYPSNADVSRFQDATGTVSGSISVTSRTNQAWIYNTALTGGRDPDLEGPFYNAANRAANPTASGLVGKAFGNALIIQEQGATAPDDEARGGKIAFSFDRAVTLSSIDLLDASKEGVTVTLLDSSNSVLGTYKNQFDGDSNRQPNWYQTILFGSGVSGVSALHLDMTNVSGAVDNIQVSAVPIPAAAWLFASALGMLGYIGKRAKQS